MIPSRLPPDGQSKSQPNFIPHRKAAFTDAGEGGKSQPLPKPHEPHLSLLNRVTGEATHLEYALSINFENCGT